MLNSFVEWKVSVCIVLISVLIHSSLLLCVWLTARRICGLKLSPRSRMIVWRMLIFAIFSMLVYFNTQNYRWSNLTVKLMSVLPEARLFLNFQMGFSIDGVSGLYKYGGEILLNCSYYAGDHRPMALLWSGDVTRIVNTALVMWTAGVIVFWVWHIIGYVILRKEIRHSESTKDAGIEAMIFSEKLYLGLSDNIEYRLLTGRTRISVSVPCVVGFFRQVIVLTKDCMEKLSPEEIEAVIAHEMQHIKKRDNCRNLLLLFLQSLLWFNPLLWYGLKKYRCDLEYLRDRQIIEMYRSERMKKIYARSIINVAKSFVGHYRSAMHSGMMNASGPGFRIHLLTDGKCSKILSVSMVILFSLIILFILTTGIHYPVMQKMMEFTGI